MRVVRFVVLASLAAAACRDQSPPVAPEQPAAPVPGATALVAPPAVLVGAGDIAFCTHPFDEATAALIDSIPGTVYTVGDNAYPNGSAADFANCYEPSWGRHKARTRPAVGNHEYHTPGAAGYFGYFGAAAGDSAKYYYSYDVGAWHVVVLNSQIDMRAASPQIQWLKSDLATSGARCTIAMWHHPRFSSGVFSGGHPETQAAWDVLYDVGAEIVLVGHEHHYERFAPQTPLGAASPSFGIRQFVVGTGGGSSYPFGTPLPNSEVRDNTTPGVLKLTLDSAGYQWQFVPIAGGTFTDAGSGTCHGVPPNARPTAAPGGPYSTMDGTVHFDGSGSSDPDGNLPLTYEWDFGDGNLNADGPRPSHTYRADGLYTVGLRVVDTRGARSSRRSTFVLVRRTATSVVFSGAGNVARCSNTNAEATAQVLDALPGFVFSAGDAAFPNGTAANFANCYHPTWGRHLTRTYAVIGNHEYDAGNANAAFDYFGSRAGPRGLGYYSFDLQDWHVIVLNDNGTFVPFGAGSAQLQWLQADLAASTKQCTIALWHTPLFLSTNTAGYTSNASRKVLWDALYAAGVDVVVNGNQHHYERMARMSPNGLPNALYGIRQFNVGTGGESLALPTVAVHPNSEVRAAVYGILSLTLRAGGYDWRFMSVAGQSFTDTGSESCHGRSVNQAPTAVPGGPYTTNDGTIHFDGGGSSDPDGDVLTYRWDFGDGATNTGQRPTHTYGADGTFTATLTVTDPSGASSAPATTSVTVTRAAGPVTLAAAGNIAKCTNNNDEATATLLHALSGYVVTLGDMAYPGGSATDYANCYQPTWGRHRTRTYPALGNRDYTAGNADATFDYFGPRAGPRGLGYYSVDLGDWHVVILNDNSTYVPYAAGSTQEQWLRGDLAASTKRCTIALWHTPLFLSTDTPGYTENPSRRVLWNALYAAGADVVLNGNQHHYERFAPMRPDGTRDDTTGIRSFNVGTGGESVGLPTVAIHPNSEARGASYGVLRLTLHADRYDWQFVTAGGTVGDAGSGTCR